MLDKASLKTINRSFPLDERQLVIDQLHRVTLDVVMARSKTNQVNTLHAILKLSEGNLEKVAYYTDCACKDFRDVIYWASEK